MGALLAAVTANAGNIEGNRGALGILNRIGDWLLLLAHRARANTVRPLHVQRCPGHSVLTCAKL